MPLAISVNRLFIDINCYKSSYLLKWINGKLFKVNCILTESKKKKEVVSNTQKQNAYLCATLSDREDVTEEQVM